MKNIRQGVFETNSSSSHSISITSPNEGELYQTLTVPDDGTLIIEGGRFGWEEEDHNDAHTKASYCATFCTKVNPSSTDMFKEVLMEHTGAKEVLIEAENCYIDHQSTHVASTAFESKDNLKDFIFGKDSWLHLDNDNH